MKAYLPAFAIMILLGMGAGMVSTAQSNHKCSGMASATCVTTHFKSVELR